MRTKLLGISAAMVMAVIAVAAQQPQPAVPGVVRAVAGGARVRRHIS